MSRQMLEPPFSPSSPTSRKRSIKKSNTSTQTGSDENDALHVQLPLEYETLLKMHAAVERAFLVHLATSGSSGLSVNLPKNGNNYGDNDECEHDLCLPNLVTYADIRPTVERSSGVKFGEEQLAQLLGLWNMQDFEPIGFQLSANPFLEKTKNIRSMTYGIGINIRVKEYASRPSMEILGPSSSPSSSPTKQHKSLHSVANSSNNGGAMNVFALWSQGVESRKQEMRRRLGSQVLAYCKESKLDANDSYLDLDNRLLPSLPKGILPDLSGDGGNTPNVTPSKELSAKDMLLRSPQSMKKKSTKRKTMSSSSSSKTSLIPQKRHKPSTFDVDNANNNRHDNYNDDDDVFGSRPLSNEPVKQDDSTCSSADIKTLKSTLSLTERIKAKEEAAKQLKQTQPGSKDVQRTKDGETDELRRKSILSRLTDVADSIYMLFAPEHPGCPTSPSSPLRTPPTRRRRAVPMNEACSVLSKSSKVYMSRAEAADALTLLSQLCDRSICIQKVNGQDWLKVPSNMASLSEIKQSIRNHLKTVSL